MNKKIDIIALGSCYIDINADNFPFSREGIPTEVELVGNSYEVVPGGSAVNFCLFSAKLGLKPAFIGMTGTDTTGGQLSSLLRGAGVQAHLVQKPELKTGVSFNMTNASGQNIMLVAGNANAALTPEAVLATLEDTLGDSRILFLGGCFKLKAFSAAFTTITTLAKRHQVAIAIDHSRIPAETTPEMLEAVKDLVTNADYYFPSREEFCQLWDMESIEVGLEYLHKTAPHLRVVVKDGANGAFFWENNELQHVPGLKLDAIVDVTGAGDSFNAGVMAGLLKGLSVRDAVSYGCRVAAAKIMRDLPLPAL